MNVNQLMLSGGSVQCMVDLGHRALDSGDRLSMKGSVEKRPNFVTPKP